MVTRQRLFSLLCTPAILISTTALSATPVAEHDNKAHCTAVTASIKEAGFADEVTVNCSGNHALIISDTYPDHELMTGIVGTNEQLPVPADYAAPIPLKPSLGSSPLTRDAALGVVVNGVPFTTTPVVERCLKKIFIITRPNTTRF